MSSSTILVSRETNDWGFGQDKFNFLKEILRIGSNCLYSTRVPLVHLVFTHPWNVSEKNIGKLHQLFANEKCSTAYLKTE